MGWAGFARSLGAAVRREERASRRRAKAAEKAWKESSRRQAQQNADERLRHARLNAEMEVEAFESAFDALTSMHREAMTQIDWTSISRRAAPATPPDRVPALQEAVSTFQPKWFERLFGLDARKNKLEADLRQAITERDDAVAAAEMHVALVSLSSRILHGELKAFGDAITGSACLQEIGETLGVEDFNLRLGASRIELTLSVDANSIVPKETKSLSAKGAVTVKKIPETRRLEVYQDYVCGVALRVGREIMAAAPTPAVLVHVTSPQIDTKTGHLGEVCVLSVLIPREILAATNWENVDASDLVTTLLHRMNVKRGKGFVAVERLSLE